MNLEAILDAHLPEGDVGEALVIADWCLERGDLPLAASALDRAHGLAPSDARIAQQRASVLDRLAIVEHGLVLRYIPAGTFRMGAEDGDPDERPVHPVRVSAFYLSETPVTWAAYCQLMGWEPPPGGFPPDDRPEGFHRPSFHLYERNKLRLQYCESSTEGAMDWHAHAPDLSVTQGGEPVEAAEVFGVPPGRDAQRPWIYDRKPMVAVSFEEAEELCARLSTPEVLWSLPTEAQWEKAARGGLIGAPWPWGHEPPTPERCDFDHFGAFHIRDPRALPPNGYGLYGMSGGVWEWTADGYWALAYRADLERPATLPERALRGGSWADCAYAVRVSHRMSRAGGSWRTGEWSQAETPNIGFRLCRSADRS